MTNVKRVQVFVTKHPGHTQAEISSQLNITPDLASGPELFAAGSADTGRNLRIGFIAYRDKQIP